MNTNQSIELPQAGTQSIEFPRDDFDVLNCLAAGRRRSILALLDRAAPMTVDELTRALDAVDGGAEGTDDSTDDRERIRVGLRHLHLPRLDEAGLVEWDPSGRTVDVADHPAIDEPGFEQFLNTTDTESDDTIACLVDEHQRTILEILESNGGELAVEQLAREASRRGPSEPDEEIQTMLHHVSLPRLDESGLVDYHVDDGRVSLCSNRALSNW